MIGWIARDEDGDLVLFDEKPYRDGEIWNARFSASSVVLDENFFNYRTEWEDEPVKVRIEVSVKEVLP
ncbi:hypothetical protein [Jeotgalibaca porci]|uniref:hypothetical protein n=1 Tax=Jeotgalibaca porci TaxID=1868793 RepID=UPI00359FE9F3